MVFRLSREALGHIGGHPAIGECFVYLFHDIVKNVHIPRSTLVFRIKIGAPVIPHGALGFLIAVNIYNGNEKAENVISDLVRIYIGASFIIIGIIYKLGKNK